jgi:predicted nucleic acid-binding protein
MLYLLDTNAVTDAMNEHPKLAVRLAALNPPDEVGICAIVRGEVLFGVQRLPDGRRKRDLSAKANRVLAAVNGHAVPASAGDHYARVKDACRRKGLPLDENDLWIAATAFALGAILVARNSDFDKVEGLHVENWTI